MISILKIVSAFFVVIFFLSGIKMLIAGDNPDGSRCGANARLRAAKHTIAPRGK
jgi:hypothetical protein